ncbi:TetR family transcriptional regulator [Prauserella sp. PE36]|uniref:TetR/AcrR family transcriptional regulator n=1 Tax=Prauserella endophytica TaxID=1592324 RepID=A0ABY2S1Y2_9PSEU|nr:MULTISPECIES: TetR/AcrR family transcriptional regulator [Prauserella]PXY25341.1 TetR family transcriptional regulator [Prauserella coralliicola]RBM23543.1 TetR family transcriptional regulator [Prauserella sp. PE36]TKG69168.1 TetR/AcrR family transcriptional regulator [Prauserella endophytica]
MDRDEATTRLLDAAEREFYERGIQSVGMDVIRARSGVSLKRLYQCFPSKETLVEAYLRRRDERWRRSLAEHVSTRALSAEDAPLAVFDWLHAWFAEEGFRGCAFINSFGELGATSPRVAGVDRAHKDALRAYLRGLTAALDVADPDALADQLLTLVEGATVIAAMSGDPSAAHTAKAAAKTLLAAALQ